MIKIAQQINDFILVPTLRYFDRYHHGFYSPSIVNLMLGTAAQESNFTFFRQQGYSYESDNGGFGLWQIEKKTEKDTKEWLAKNYPHLAHKIHLAKAPILNDIDNLIGNLPYSILIGRSSYLSIKRPLPAPDDIEGLANYWNDYYNRNEEHGTVEEFIENYNRYVL